MTIWEQLQEKGYTVYNKRVMGNPLYTSRESKEKDLIQEQALIVKWLRIKHNIEIVVFPERTERELKFYSYQIWLYKTKDVTGFVFKKQGEESETPEQATEAAIRYCLESLI